MKKKFIKVNIYINYIYKKNDDTKKYNRIKYLMGKNKSQNIYTFNFHNHI